MILVSGCGTVWDNDLSGNPNNISKIDEKINNNNIFSKTTSNEYFYYKNRYTGPIEVDLSCLKNSSMKCSEKVLNMKKAAEIAMENVSNGIGVQSIGFTFVKLSKSCDEYDDVLCIKEPKYIVWINGPFDGSSHYCYNQSIVTIDGNSWKIIDAEKDNVCDLQLV